MLLKLFCVLVVFEIGVQGSPFELVENYIEDFTKDIKEVTTYLDAKAKNAQTQNEYAGFSEEESKIKDIGAYDFIIIGGGTSGSVIASRLSEVPEWTVLLLEAGYEETRATKVPQMNKCLQSSGSPLTWGYYSIPQNNSCLDAAESKCFIPTAKAVGGTTAINDMIYTRGNPRDYDLWADTGLKGWCSISLGPYFKKIEDAQLDTVMDHASHHYGGPIHLESPHHHSEIADKFLAGAKEIGLKEIDLNGKNSLGCGFPQLMTQHGERYSASEAYLKQAKKRKNLQIHPLSQVTKILISEHTKEARGVQFIHDGHLFTASANKEVILASGAINSAKLLLLSGIGPHDELKHLKIEPVSDLQVGKNLIHHAVFPITYLYNTTHHTEAPFYYSKEIDYLRNGRGPLTSTGVDVISFIKTEYSKGRHSYPDVELLVSSDPTKQQYIDLRTIDGTIEVEAKGEKSFRVNLILLHPKSRGTLKLHSHEHLDHPLIDLNDFSDEHDDDIETLLSAVRTTQKILHTHPFEKLDLHHLVFENCKAFEIDSPDYWRCAIKHRSISIGEVTSTAPMGAEKEGKFGEFVVDSHLRVHGVEKLRVADDSVIPVSISGHLAAVKIVIGEKCADLVKEEWAK